jgi:hypothetical protein
VTGWSAAQSALPDLAGDPLPDLEKILVSPYTSLAFPADTHADDGPWLL